MLTVEATTNVASSVEEVWRYLADANHVDTLIAHEPGDEIRKTSDGPLTLGSTLEMRGEFRSRKMVMEARVSEYELNRKLSLEYVSGPFRGSKKVYVLEPRAGEGGTKITHISIGVFHGMWKVMAFLLRPVARKGLKKSAEDELAGITSGISG